MTISWYSIFVDQVETGLEREYLSSSTIREARSRYNLGRKTIYPLNARKLRLRIWETIHYRVLVDSSLSELFDRYMVASDQNEHSYTRFNELVGEMESRPLQQKILLAECENGYCIIDGAHRAAILFNKSRSIVQKENFVFTDQSPARTENLEFAIKKSLKKSRPRFKSPLRRWANPSQFEAGYHSFEVAGVKIEGQRNPIERLELITQHFDLVGASVLDLGCNTGGMLFHQEQIARGIGLDIDPRSIRAAEGVRKALSDFNKEFSNRFEFFVADLDHCDMRILDQLLRSERIEVAFALSLGSWLRDWQRLYGYLIRSGIPFVLETNNELEGRSQLSFIKSEKCEVTTITEKSLDDKSGNWGRAMYLVTSPLASRWPFGNQRLPKR